MLRTKLFSDSTSLGWALNSAIIKLLAAALSLMAVISSNAKAADIVVGEKGIIVIVGRIEPGDEEKFRRTVIAEIHRRGSVDPVGILHVYSPGGDLGSALKIGEQVHLLQLTTWSPSKLPSLNRMLPFDASTVNTYPRDGIRYCELPGENERRERASAAHSRYLKAQTEAWAKGSYSYPRFTGQLETFNSITGRGDSRCECASACFFIWAAGAIRAGDVVGIHRPSFDPTQYSKLSPGEARAQYNLLMDASKSYLTKVGIPQELINRTFAINSTKTLYLTDTDLSRLQHSPHLEELLIAKCGKPASQMELREIIQNKFANKPKWNPDEHNARAERYLGAIWCQTDALREAHRQTNAEYLRMYDRVRSPGSHP